MRDSILTAILAFAVLVGGTAAVGHELLRVKTHEVDTRPVVTLPAVTVVGKRQPSRLALDAHREPAARVQ